MVDRYQGDQEGYEEEDLDGIGEDEVVGPGESV